HARHIEVRTRGDSLVVSDDGDDLDDDLLAVLHALHMPEVAALHRLEQRQGTDLLVALATARRSESIGRRGQRLMTIAGTVDRCPVDVPAARNTIRLERSRNLRRQERAELRAWLPAPRARIVVDGRALRMVPALPATTVLPRTLPYDVGQLQLGFALDDTVTRLTVRARGVWVAQEHLRADGLPIIAVWDDHRLPPTTTDLVGPARHAVQHAGLEAHRALAAAFPTLPLPLRRRLRALLLRPTTLHPAFVDVALFDDDGGPFAVSLATLQQRDRIVVGRADDGGGADVVADGDVVTFLERALAGRVVEALPAPTPTWRRRLRVLVR
ncbi:MAG TPA: hypothetical protein VGF99_21115, partial [Myxococcota bacterium]